MNVDNSIDCKGLACPEPILHTKMAINKMESGQILEVFTTDPGSINDMAAWSRRTKNPIVDKSEDGDVFRFLIQKA